MKKTQVTISGKQITLNLGVNYFYKFFLEATGIDLIKEGLVEVQSVRIFDYVAGFIYAGAKAESMLTKQPFELTFDAVSHEVMSMNEKEASELLMTCALLMSGEKKDDDPNAVTQGD